MNNQNKSVDESDTKMILCMCIKCLPALKQIRHGKIQVDFRSYRDNGIRLEYEDTAHGIDIGHCLWTR